MRWVPIVPGRQQARKGACGTGAGAGRTRGARRAGSCGGRAGRGERRLTWYAAGQSRGRRGLLSSGAAGQDHGEEEGGKGGKKM
eukprot:scaffold3_cov108-Isochrysis_galbana.AAC.6